MTEAETLKAMVDYLTALENKIRGERQDYEAKLRELMHAQI